MQVKKTEWGKPTKPECQARGACPMPPRQKSQRMGYDQFRLRRLIEPAGRG